MDLLALGQLASDQNDCFSDHYLVPQRSVTSSKGKEVVGRDRHPAMKVMHLQEDVMSEGHGFKSRSCHMGFPPT